MLKRIHHYLFREYLNWAEQSKPLLRYEQSRNTPDNRSQARFWRIIGWVGLLSVLVLGGYFFATKGLQTSLDRPYSQALWRVVIIPLFLMQVLLQVAALSLGVGAVGAERRRQTWDNLRATERGTEISLQTRFPAIFSQLLGIAAFIAIGRLLLLGAILYEVMSFQGDYLNLLSARSNPAVLLELGMILLGAFMTAFVLLPITSTSFNIALGLCISAWVRNRAVAAILQMLLVGLRVLGAGLLFYYSWQLLFEGIVLEPIPALGLLSSAAAFGDWGLLLSQLSLAGEFWRTVPYSIFIGLGLLIWLVIQALLTQGLLKLAVRAAELRE
jgi:hypothetical protein